MGLLRYDLGKLPISRLLVRARPSLTPVQWPRILPQQRRGWRFNSTLAAAPTSTPPEILEPAAPAAPVQTQGIALRDYQEECIQSVVRYVDEGHKRLGVSLATGSGKTVIFTQLISRIPPRERGNKTLIIVHRRELVEQAAHHCRLAYPDKHVDIEMGAQTAKEGADIIVASIRSLVSKDRIYKFDPQEFKLVLVDEAHHIVASSYRQVLGYMDLNEPTQGSPLLVGVSATFSRFDGLKLGAAIDHIVYHKDYVDMIDEKWLANTVFTTVRSEADLSKVKKDKSGDFALGSLSQAVNTDTTNNITVRAWMANASDRKSTLAFCVDLEHTRSLTETFRQYGVDARYLTSGTPKDIRWEQLQAFKEQKFPVLINCGIFTEGTDIPNIDCVLLVRPTKSRNLLIQMIGRGLRLFPGKENCHIIDMVATLETGVLSTPTLFGLHPDEVLNKSNMKQLQEKKDQLPELERQLEQESIAAAAKSVQNEQYPEEDIKISFTRYDTIADLIGDMRGDKHIRSLSQYTWVRAGEDRFVLSGSNGWITIQKNEDDTAEPEPESNLPTPTPSSSAFSPLTQPNLYKVYHVRKIIDSLTDRHIFTRPRPIAQGPDLETAVRAADTFASDAFPSRYIDGRQPWRRQPASQAQIDMLNRANLKKGRQIGVSEVTRGQAADLITKLKFGGKSRFQGMMRKRLKSDEREENVREIRRSGLGGVRVGPVEA